MIYEACAVTKLIIHSSLCNFECHFLPKICLLISLSLSLSLSLCSLRLVHPAFCPSRFCFLSSFTHPRTRLVRHLSRLYFFSSREQSHEKATQCTVQLRRPLIHSIDALTWLWMSDSVFVCKTSLSHSLAFVMTLITHFLFLFLSLSLWLYLLRLNFYHFSSSIIIYIYTRHTQICRCMSFHIRSFSFFLSQLCTRSLRLPVMSHFKLIEQFQLHQWTEQQENDTNLL